MIQYIINYSFVMQPLNEAYILGTSMNVNSYIIALEIIRFINLVS